MATKEEERLQVLEQIAAMLRDLGYEVERLLRVDFEFLAPELRPRTISVTAQVDDRVRVQAWDGWRDAAEPR